MIASAAKISVIGAGHVGATFAYTLLLSGLAREVVLVDKDTGRAEGEALDLAHAAPFGRPMQVRAGAVADVAGSAVVAIAAGRNQHPGETRLDLLGHNAGIAASVAAEVAACNPDGVIVCATNPVDILARIAHETSGLPAGRIIGSGTILDTARFRHLIGRHFGVDPRNVHAYVVGEHGDSSVAVWSSASIGGIGLSEAARVQGVPFDADVRKRIENDMRGAAYAIVAGKGSTYYAIAAGLLRLVEAVVRDQHTVLTVSNMNWADASDGVWLSMPATVAASGLGRTLPISLNADEEQALARSADVLRKAYGTLSKAPPRTE